MPRMTCPICKKDVELILYGNGWIGVCCEKLIYNAVHPPQAGQNKIDLSSAPWRTNSDRDCGKRDGEIGHSSPDRY